MYATIQVFTFKAGLLARVAHDLRLTLREHEASVQAGRIRASGVADSLRIDGVMTSHGLDAHTLSAKDQSTILETVQSEILQTRRYPRIEFEGSIEPRSANMFAVRGELRLRGRTRPIKTDLIRSGDRLQASFELKPSEFGIAPYKALGGAIKLDDRVRVSIAIALDGQDPKALIERADPLQLQAAGA
ncbi:MAG TPA: YceI family protein [Polyangiales bacterium]|nr:YceI family protein [Polyangiales bacterium]